MAGNYIETTNSNSNTTEPSDPLKFTALPYGFKKRLIELAPQQSLVNFALTGKESFHFTSFRMRMVKELYIKSIPEHPFFKVEADLIDVPFTDIKEISNIYVIKRLILKLKTKEAFKQVFLHIRGKFRQLLWKCKLSFYCLMHALRVRCVKKIYILTNIVLNTPEKVATLMDWANKNGQRKHQKRLRIKKSAQTEPEAVLAEVLRHPHTYKFF